MSSWRGATRTQVYLAKWCWYGERTALTAPASRRLVAWLQLCGRLQVPQQVVQAEGKQRHSSSSAGRVWQAEARQWRQGVMQASH
jgi:hypothetical protein